jgi:hypothetical protein
MPIKLDYHCSCNTGGEEYTISVPPCLNGGCNGTGNSSTNLGGHGGSDGNCGRGGRNNRGRGRNGRGGGRGSDGNSSRDSTPQLSQGPWVCFNPFTLIPPAWRGASTGGTSLLGPAPSAYQSTYATSFAPLQMSGVSPPASPSGTPWLSLSPSTTWRRRHRPVGLSTPAPPLICHRKMVLSHLSYLFLIQFAFTVTCIYACLHPTSI